MYTRYTYTCDTVILYTKKPATNARSEVVQTPNQIPNNDECCVRSRTAHTHICIRNLWMSIFIGKITVEQYTDEHKCIFSNYHNSTRNKTTNCLYSNEYVSKPNKMWIEWACENRTEMKIYREKIMNFGQIDKGRTHFRFIQSVHKHSHFVKFQSVFQLFNYIYNFK